MTTIEIAQEKCISCKNCVNICPMGVYEVQEEIIQVKNQNDCIACRACEAICPNDAITIEE
jgi:NAD-dependent dihydropyrimidine dehydrogenase PreA subunit